MRIINNEGEFKKAWDDAKRESAAAFGNDGLYLEKFGEKSRVTLKFTWWVINTVKHVTFQNVIAQFNADTRNLLKRRLLRL